MRRIPWAPIILALLIGGLVYGLREYEYQAAKNMYEWAKTAINRFVPSEEITVEDIELDVMRRLESLKNRLGEGNVKEIFEETDAVLRGFVTNLFNMPYSFTAEELEQDLKEHSISPRTRNETSRLFKLIEENKYRESEIKKEEMSTIIDSAIRVVKSLGDEEAKILKRLALKRTEEAVKEAKSALESNNLIKAREAYLRANELYKKLEEKEKAKIYKELVSIYKELEKRGTP